MQLIILCGGLGTRLRKRIGNKPKGLAQICGKPILQWQVELACRSGITDIHFLTGFGHDQLVSYFKDGSDFGVNITYHQEPKALGTAGSVRHFAEYLEEDFIVMYGDTMLDVDLSHMVSAYQDSGADALLFVHPNSHPFDSDLVAVDRNNHITGFYASPHGSGGFRQNLVNAALYVLSKKAVLSIPQSDEVCDFGKHVFPEWLISGKHLFAYHSVEYIKDAGTPDRLDQVSEDINSGLVVSRSLSSKKNAIFFDRDGVLNEEVSRVKHVDELKMIECAASAVKLVNQSSYLALVATNQPVLARGDCDEDMFHQIHWKLETKLGDQGAFVDDIFYCPHHPDKGFLGEIAQLKVSCDCRKPKKGMLLAAEKKYHLDLNQSWFIGDSARDILCAKNAGVKSILVQTGHAGLDDPKAYLADFVFKDVLESVSFILNEMPKYEAYFKEHLPSVSQNDIIIVGGFARSGKSTFANALKYYLAEKNIPCASVSCDHWLVSKDERKDNVLGRYDIARINHFVDAISNGERNFKLPLYDRQKMESIDNAFELNLSKDVVLILEGVVAFETDAAQKANLSFWVEVEEAIRKSRFDSYNAARGLASETAEFYYEQRLQDENEVIKHAKGTATVRVNL